MPECVVCQDAEGRYAHHDQHFIICSGCRDRWIEVLDRENARVIGAKLEVKCPVCRKLCIFRKGRRLSSVDLFFGFRIRYHFFQLIYSHVNYLFFSVQTSLCIIQKLPAILISHPEFSFTTLVSFSSS